MGAQPRGNSPSLVSQDEENHVNGGKEKQQRERGFCLEAKRFIGGGRKKKRQRNWFCVTKSE